MKPHQLNCDDDCRAEVQPGTELEEIQPNLVMNIYVNTTRLGVVRESTVLVITRGQGIRKQVEVKSLGIWASRCDAMRSSKKRRHVGYWCAAACCPMCFTTSSAAGGWFQVSAA